MKTKRQSFLVCLAALAILAGPVSAYAWSVQKLKGEVMIESKGKKTAAAVGTELKEGDVVETAAEGKAMLLDNESEIWLVSGTRFKVHKLTNADQTAKGRLDILSGKLRAKIKKPSGPQDYPYEIRMKAVVAGVRGTEFFMALDGDEEKVCTFEGMVRVSSLKSAAEGWDVGAGKGLFAKANEMPKVRDTTAEQIKKWKDMSSF